MSATPFGPNRQPLNPDLMDALAEMAAYEANLTPAERDSVRAAQMLSAGLSGMIPSTRDELHRLRAKLASLQALLEALKNPDTTDHFSGHLIRQLVEEHRTSKIKSVTGYIADVRLMISTAGPI